jgi:hypothetical protein
LYDKNHSIECARTVAICCNKRARQLREWFTRFTRIDLIDSKGKSTMTNLKLFSIAALLSAVMTPVIAQQAVQEPGAQAFYQSLGVGSGSRGTANALAFAGRPALSINTPAKRHARAASRHFANAHR